MFMFVTAKYAKQSYYRDCYTYRSPWGGVGGRTYTTFIVIIVSLVFYVWSSRSIAHNATNAVVSQVNVLIGIWRRYPVWLNI